jgi:hypothetical protein
MGNGLVMIAEKTRVRLLLRQVASPPGGSPDLGTFSGKSLALGRFRRASLIVGEAALPGSARVR